MTDKVPSATQRARLDDCVVSEEPLQVWIKHPLKNKGKSRLLVTTMRSPGDDIALVTGWLFTSGLIKKPVDIHSVTHTGSQRLKGLDSNQVLVTLHPDAALDVTADIYRAAQRIEYVNSGCGVCGQRSIDTLLDILPQRGTTEEDSGLTLTLPMVLALGQRLREAQVTFSLTGGAHGAGLFTLNANNGSGFSLSDVREDIGRHNALDKLIGANLPLLSSGALSQFGVVLSSRISFDLVQKAAMANIHYILAMGAPSSLAIELAEQCDICLIGFIQRQRMNIYTCAHKVNE